MIETEKRTWQLTEWLTDPGYTENETIITVIGAIDPCDLETATLLTPLLRHRKKTKIELFSTNLNTKEKNCYIQQGRGEPWHDLSVHKQTPAGNTL